MLESPEIQKIVYRNVQHFLHIFFEIYELFSIFYRKFLNFERILTELRSEKFEWFDPSPIEPFNFGLDDGEEGLQPLLLVLLVDPLDALLDVLLPGTGVSNGDKRRGAQVPPKFLAA